MLKIDDFATIYCLTKSSIEKKLKPLLPIFKKFQPKKRKTRYTIAEANIVFRQLGIPPRNEYNRNLKAKWPELDL